MTEDAKFEDGAEAPLSLGAVAPDDLEVISSLVQDAVFPATEMAWRPNERRFAILLNRFRWEDTGRDRHDPERVQSVLVIDNVTHVASQGVDPGDTATILSLLAVTYETGADQTEQVLLTLAGDGAIRLKVAALQAMLKDVTRPYRAPSGKVPDHDG